MTILDRWNTRKQRATGMRSPASKYGMHKHKSPLRSTSPAHRSWMRSTTQILLQEASKRRVVLSQHTSRTIDEEVRSLLRSGPCSVAALAAALSGSNTVMSSHGRLSSSLSAIRRITRQFRELALGRRSSRESLERRYQLVGALHSLEKSKQSHEQKVATVEQARQALSKVLHFPNVDEPVPAATDTQNDTDRAIEAVKQERAEEERRQSTRELHRKIQEIIERQKDDPGLRCHAWRKVTAFTVNEKLVSDDKNKKGFVHSVNSADAMLSKQLRTQLEMHYERATGETVAATKARFLEKERLEEAKKRASSLMRPLTPEEEDVANGAIWGQGPGSEVMAQAGTDSIQRNSMHRLRPGEWLNDEVIHYFYVMLAKRDEELQAKDTSRKRSHFFKSFFMTKLLNEGNASKEGVYEYRNVKRWSKKVPGKNIFNLDKVFFPINQGGMHWVCAVAFIQDKRIQMFDSMGSPGLEYLENIFQYLKDEHLDKQKSELPDQDKWELVPCQQDTPRQRNGYDCGVFTCMFADFLSKDCPLLFDQEHVDLCRKRIAISIMKGKAIM